MWVDLEKCAKNTDCRIFTLSDKMKKDSLLLCIMVHDTETCYTSNCFFKEKRQKRSLESTVNLNETKTGSNLKAPNLLCEFDNSEFRYGQDKTFGKSCQNESSHVIASRNDEINEGTSTFKEGYICHSQNIKENNPGFYAILCLGGTVFGIFLGVCVTYVYLKRVPKSLPVSEEKQSKNITVRKDIFSDITEYSEIPYTLDNFKVEETLLRGEKTDDIRKHRCVNSKIPRFEDLHASPSMIVQIDMSEPPFQNDGPKEKFQEDMDYVEPQYHQYHHMTQRTTINDVTVEAKKHKHKNTLANREECKAVTETNVNTIVVNNDVKMSDMTQEYHQLTECATLNTGLYLPQKKGDAEAKLCSPKDESNVADSVYFVLSANPPSSEERFDEADVKEDQKLHKMNSMTEQYPSGSEYLHSTHDDFKAGDINDTLYTEIEENT
ncbi:uncharacterized protein LOC133203700 [Saccostrea echinata]|uniref:uncharacterized protein LOC133203700 n=1 Tax=Saccostrea echinata TaxID=191078 RepID=UPI002A8215FB|nr:uncharacterized protein LOC133203700 [Saccostrea echinata]